ncbi:MAG: glutamate--tRNA ligase [Dehalococcoidia bacterium]|nr:glutamate--tRNA ligase [Dehalococcoidia bacterium]
MTSDKESQVRVRFAPSPTGYPHVGNIRTALFNWLFARHHGGTFILRIEDTDTARRVEGAVESIMDGLRWLGLDWDEGPIFQSDRLALYRSAADTLVKNDMAYHCFCSAERLDQVRAEQSKQKLPPRYDGHCRALTPEEAARRVSDGEPSVVRFKTPLDGDTVVPDLIRGDVTFANATLNDYVLLKSDGYPTYHLANVVDDHDMRISHIMRADEWISSTPLHVMLYNAFGWTPPAFAHLPMILGPDKAKLSKRHGATTVTEYRDQGYLPEALFNFLALLGWSLDDKTELFTRDELVAAFTLERVGKTAAVFNMPKLDWMNGVYIRGLSHDEFASRALPYLQRDLPPAIDRPLDLDYVVRVAALVQERAKVLSEVAGLCDFFFIDALSYPESELVAKGMDARGALAAVHAVSGALISIEVWNSTTLEAAIRPLADTLELSPKQLFGVLRVAITGRTAAPPLFDTMEVLGRARCGTRLAAAASRLQAQIDSQGREGDH